MSIDVYVVTESGLELDRFIDEDNVLELLLPATHDTSSYCLRFVNPNGRAVFNQQQLPFLLSELESAAQDTRNEAARKHGSRLLKGLRKYQGKMRTHFRFVGRSS